jgi:alpha-glucosidase
MAIRQLGYPVYSHSIHHDGSPRYVRRGDRGCSDPVLGEEITIRLRAGLDAPIERVLIRTCPDGEQLLTSMQADEPGPACRWWRAQIRLSMRSTGYRFLLFTADGAWWYNGMGLHRHTPTDADDFQLLADYAAPAWVRDSVFYQIFPDRFADGDPANNVRDGEFEYRGQLARATHWGEPPLPAGHPAKLVEFFGGDLAGIEQRLDYLAELGVNALYLNPIFTAYSNHRYDVVDYFHVDPHLGGDRALASLRQACTSRGMRLILDIVPNHCGVAHPWFQAALADRQAPTAEYFSFRPPDDYASWLGVRSLPKLNYRSQALREVMYAGPDAVFRHWLRPPYRVNGWRLDVANMLGRQGPEQLGHDVLRGIRCAVKEEDPAAYILGENFFDATRQLQGDGLDAAMNYTGFANPVGYWLDGFQISQHAEPRRIVSEAPWPAAALVDTWQAYAAAVPWIIARQQFNLLGSHDTPRVLEIVGGDLARNRLAAGLLFTYVGVPSIYYGEEIGLVGDNRAPMPWDPAAWNQDLRAFYQALVRLRRTSPALIAGGFQVLSAEEETISFLRDADEEQIVVVGHRGPAVRPAQPLWVAPGAIPDGAEFVELFSGSRATVAAGRLPLPPLPPGITIWRAHAGPTGTRIQG